MTTWLFFVCELLTWRIGLTSNVPNSNDWPQCGIVLGHQVEAGMRGKRYSDRKHWRLCCRYCCLWSVSPWLWRPISLGFSQLWHMRYRPLLHRVDVHCPGATHEMQTITSSLWRPLPGRHRADHLSHSLHQIKKLHCVGVIKLFSQLNMLKMSNGKNNFHTTATLHACVAICSEFITLNSMPRFYRNHKCNLIYKCILREWRSMNCTMWPQCEEVIIAL